MYQPAHVQFPKTLTFCALLCRLFNPIPQGSETVHISKARNWIFHCWNYADCLTHRCYLCQIPESRGVPIKAKKFPTPFVGFNFWSFPRLPGVRNKAFIINQNPAKNEVSSSDSPSASPPGHSCITEFNISRFNFSDLKIMHGKKLSVTFLLKDLWVSQGFFSCSSGITLKILSFYFLGTVYAGRHFQCADFSGGL